MCIGSFATAAFSCFLHIYVVQTNIQAYKDTYVKEIEDQLGTYKEQAALTSVNGKQLESIKQLLMQYGDQQLSRQYLYSQLKKIIVANKAQIDRQLQQVFDKKPVLKDTRYTAKFTHIELYMEGRKDTIVFNHIVKVGAGGKDFKDDGGEILTLSKDMPMDFLELEESPEKGFQFSYTIKKTESVEVSSWKYQIFWRMLHIWIMVGILAIAESYLWYMVWKTFWKELKLSAMKTDFANNITHELQTPLTSMSIIFKSIELDAVRSNPQLFDEYIDSMQRQYTKIQQTVDSVLESTFADHELKLTATAIESYLVAYAREILMEKHFFRTEIAPQQIQLMIDPLALEKVLDNLIQNAIKYTPEGSHISLTAEPDKMFYVIRVTDNGPGIAKKHQAAIFNKFYRISEQNKHAVKGLGLGLYLCKQAIIKMKGTLTVTSEPGEGCDFRIRLPIEEAF
jgi:two-component system phosphate regulon sensor histidine kinase PhoR